MEKFLEEKASNFLVRYAGVRPLYLENDSFYGFDISSVGAYFIVGA
jgi:hypothetical protein